MAKLIPIEEMRQSVRGCYTFITEPLPDETMITAASFNRTDLVSIASELEIKTTSRDTKTTILEKIREKLASDFTISYWTIVSNSVSLSPVQS